MRRLLAALLGCVSRKHFATVAHIFVLTLMVLSAFVPVLVNPGVAYAASPFTKLADPTGGLPPDQGRGVAFSPDSNYVAVTTDISPFVIIYKRSGDTFARLPDPVGGLPPNQGRGVAFSHDSIYLAVTSSSTSTYITIYKRSGDIFTKLTNLVSSVPDDYGKGVDFSPDSTYMAVSHQESPFVTVYKKVGDTFTQLPDPLGGLPGGLGRGVAISPDSNYMAVASQNSPYINIYKRSGDTFTKLANPADLPTAQGRAIAFSPDSIYLTIIYDASPYIAVYKRSGDTFTRLANPTLSGVRDGGGISFSPDSVYMAIAHHNSPYLTIYNRSGDIFTKVEDPALIPTAQGRDLSFSPNSLHLALGSDDSPYIRIYKYAFAAPTIAAVNPASGTQVQTLDIIITGTAFFGVMTSDFGPGITVNSVTVNSPAQVTVNISITAGAAAGIRNVTVTTSGGTATKTGGFTVIEVLQNTMIGTGAPTSHGSSVSAPTSPAPPVSLPILVIQNASLSAKTVTPGTPVTVNADIANKSTVNGSKRVTLYVNGQVETTQGITVNSGGSTQLTFSVSRNEPGDYIVYVDGVPAGSFKVEMFRESDGILIFSAVLVALAFLVGMVMLWRRQRAV